MVNVLVMEEGSGVICVSQRQCKLKWRYLSWSCRKRSSSYSAYCNLFSIVTELTGVTVCLDVSSAFVCFKAVYLLPYNTRNTAHISVDRTASVR